MTADNAPEVGLTDAERCAWGQKGLPACKAGTRSRRYWCNHCLTTVRDLDTVLTEAERREFEGIEDSGETQGLAHRVARIKADAARQALLDAAGAIWAGEGGYAGGVQWGRSDYVGWLRDRAARLNDGSGS